ncbi:hypothetical protein [Nocardioides jensenii]|uniref:hypothetical protein n=1 Tax=Nocardioides jensenii TaxID=1843 RepID=UPI00082CF9F4|nr:hypothetical protein [Nocardioides jensenii]
MAEWRHRQRAAELVGALIEGGNRLIRRRPGDLGTFLLALDGTEAGHLLASPEGRRDALVHLGTAWQATVTVLARPDTLPEVVEHRTRVRVHPAAPWLTAGVAAAGSGAVVAGSAPVALEALGAAAVAAVTALGAGWLWRPRPSRSDRRFVIGGAAALTARAQALVSRQTGHGSELRGAHRLLALIEGGSEEVAHAEHAAAEAGLMDESHQLVVGTAMPPSHHALVDDVLLQRAELVRSLLGLQQLVVRVDEDARRSRRDAYRRLLDDPLDDL